MATKNVLWGKSLDQCALPGCVQTSSVTNVGAKTGDVFHTPVHEHVHIRSKKSDGPRYDPGCPTEKLDHRLASLVFEGIRVVDVVYSEPAGASDPRVTGA